MTGNDPQTRGSGRGTHTPGGGRRLSSGQVTVTTGRGRRSAAPGCAAPPRRGDTGLGGGCAAVLTGDSCMKACDARCERSQPSTWGDYTERSCIPTAALPQQWDGMRLTHMSDGTQECCTRPSANRRRNRSPGPPSPHRGCRLRHQTPQVTAPQCAAGRRSRAETPRFRHLTGLARSASRGGRSAVAQQTDRSRCIRQQTQASPI
ncbi:hypothetical protein SCOCK_610029 [Actinacidiphila cocklensis]|uniref:Uncharacterized protein n=1 Tax=Actinacidiphila cocklensis TaxID=887465 RepID=A0A9W4DXJ9_9ACTN|nr:hypothetical protein SCOCK_610029 [Actinacidiphila cocklensis]